MNEVMRVVKQVRAEIIKNEPALFSTIYLSVSLGEADRFVHAIENLRDVELSAI
jgi:hypothetical protein